jgi:hypothetical protein
MSFANRVCAGGAGMTALIIGIGLAWGESGTTTGVAGGNSGNNLDVKVTTVEGKKSTTKQWRFQHGADTETTLGDDKIRAGEVRPAWKVTVTWTQAADEKANPVVNPNPKPVPNPVVPIKKGEVVVPKKVEVPKFVVPVNRNPMVAEKIVVAVKSQAVTFAGFDGTDKVKITVDDAGAAVKGKAPAKRTKDVTANLFDTARFFVDAEEVDRAALKDREGQEAKADIIDDGAVVPTVFRLTFKKSVEK